MKSIADVSGVTPARGTVIGGERSHSPIIWRGNDAFQAFLDRKVAGSRLDTSTFKCYFNFTTTKETPALLLAAVNNTKAVSCNPPQSYDGYRRSTSGIAGEVAVQLSLDGQHLLEPPVIFTYICETNGYYYIPSPKRGNCMPCVDGAECYGNQTVLAKAGYYAVRPPTLFQKCFSPFSCNRTDLNKPCAEHYEGLMCAMCSDGYGSNFDFICAECGSNWKQFGIILTGILAALFVSTVITVYTIYKMEGEDSYKEGTNVLITIGLTGISMLQSMTFFKGFDYEWPSFVDNMFSTAEAVSGSSISVRSECWTRLFSGVPYVYTNAVFMILLAPTCLLAIVIGLLIWHACSGGNLLRRVKIATMYVVFLFQPYALRAILQALTCKAIDGKSVLYYQPDIECGSSSHMKWSCFLVTIGVLYGIVLPLWKFKTMYNDRELIFVEDEEALRSYGFAINAFEAEYYYWQLVIMLRKIGQTTVITLARPLGVVVQAQFALMVTMLAIVAHVYARPFKNKRVNYLEVASLGAFMFTAWLGVLMSQSGFDDDARQAMSITLVSANAISVGWVVWAFVTELWGKIKTVKSKGEEVSNLEESSTIEVEMTTSSGGGGEDHSGDDAHNHPDDMALSNKDREAAAEDEPGLAQFGHMEDDDKDLKDEEDAGAATYLPTMGTYETETSLDELEKPADANETTVEEPPSALDSPRKSPRGTGDDGKGIEDNDEDLKKEEEGGSMVLSV